MAVSLNGRGLALLTHRSHLQNDKMVPKVEDFYNNSNSYKHFFDNNYPYLSASL